MSSRMMTRDREVKRSRDRDHDLPSNLRRASLQFAFEFPPANRDFITQASSLQQRGVPIDLTDIART